MKSGNRVLHYVSFDYDDLEIHHKNSMMSIACKAFILGCANHAVHDNNDWFSFNVCQWSKIAMNQRKRTLQEIDDYMKRHNIFYTLSGNKITIDNKRKQVLQTMAAEEKEKIAKVKLPKAKTPVEPIVEEIEETIPEEETVEDIPEVKKETLDNILDLGEEKPFSFDIFKKLYEYGQNNPCEIDDRYNSLKKIADLNKINKALIKYDLDVNTLVRSKENLFEYIKKDGKNLGDNFKEIKDNARIEYGEVTKKICKGLSALYDKNVKGYHYFVLYLFKTQQKFLTLNIK